MLTVADALAECEVFKGLAARHQILIAGCGRFTRFPTRSYILRMDGPADRFYLLREGSVALEVPTPGRGSILIQTLQAGDVLGWSWLFPPYRWQLDALAREPVAAVGFDGACLRAKCDEDHELGYQLMRRFGAVMLQRLIATRFQLLDVYGDGRH